MAENKKKEEEIQEQAQEQTSELTPEQSEKMVSIRLPLTKEEKDDVFVRVNQRTWLIKRGVTVQVPACVVEVLEHSEQAMLEAMQFQEAHEKNNI